MSDMIFVLGDQLSMSGAALRAADKENDVVLMVEASDETTYVRHHKKKIAFVLSAMRHFADDLKKAGYTVEYVKLDDPDNTGSFTGELKRAVQKHKAERVRVVEPGEWRVREMMDGWADEIGVPVDILTDDRFVCDHETFEAWADGRKQLRMEYFYRDMRRQTGYLMDEDGSPTGGQWNFDHDNRERLPDDFEPPKRESFKPDAITNEVLDLVSNRFDNHFGDLEPFWLAVKRDDALKALDHFIEDCLPDFGAYQDAMKKDAPFLFHSLISPYLNNGLLTPTEVCDAAAKAYEEGNAPINAVEGFIRQIIGWREYVRGIYWLKMPDYKETNALSADRPLPDFYWTAETDMDCLKSAISETKENAYAHHIQRLMVTGNFALLAGIAPDDVHDWYISVYADAYEWVELPNTHGMAIFADGGIMASKPYAASGAYINRMSDYCGDCRYKVSKKEGPDACPFNYLYWNFLMENREALKSNHRLGMIYRSLDKMTDARKAQIRSDADQFFSSLEAGEVVASA
ncbi:MAG: cryptochrome/photolyase family protein [Pseudomonadota bacterium]